MTDFIGSLSVAITKKGKKEFKAKYSNHKGKEVTMPLLPQVRFFNDNDAVDGDSINIAVNDKNQIEKVVLQGKEEHTPITEAKQTAKHDNYGGRQQNPRGSISQSTGTSQKDILNGGAKLPPATAPYNFIPQDKVLYIESDAEGSQVQKKACYSGHIVCSLELLSPLLISGEQSKESPQRGPSHKRFFTVQGKPTIPGTSLKGMVRNLVETMSLSTLAPVNNRKLFWRNIDDKDYYMAKMLHGSGRNAQGKQQAGFLYRKGADYFITPVGEPKRVLRNSAKNAEALRVETGRMPNKKHDYDFNYKPIADDIVVADELVKAFKAQLTKAQESHVQKMYNKSIEDMMQKSKGHLGLPVFYLSAGNGVDFFGLAKLFRYPSRYSVVELRDRVMGKSESKIDFAAHLFGYTSKNKSQAGRVAIEHAQFDTSVSVEQLEPTVLGQPCETCLAHYLDQNIDRIRTLAKNRNRHDILSMQNYNAESKLRGRKYYWHRDVEMIAPPINTTTGIVNDNVASVLHPIMKGNKTHFTMYLKHVSLEELGALLLTLELPHGHAHKLGMGKSLGLGSVRIAIESCQVTEDFTFYSKLQERCALFLDTQKEKAVGLDEVKREEAKNAFKVWVLCGLGKQSTVESFEKLEHIQALRHMMNYETKPQNERTKTMKLDDFKERRVLPKPLEVK